MAQLQIPLVPPASPPARLEGLHGPDGRHEGPHGRNYQKSALTEDERKFFSGVKNVRYVIMLAENWCAVTSTGTRRSSRTSSNDPNAELRVFLRDQARTFATRSSTTATSRSGRGLLRPELERGRPLVRARARRDGQGRADPLHDGGYRAEGRQAKQDAAMNEFRNAVNSAYHAQVGPVAGARPSSGWSARTPTRRSIPSPSCRGATHGRRPSAGGSRRRRQARQGGKMLR